MSGVAPRTKPIELPKEHVAVPKAFKAPPGVQSAKHVLKRILQRGQTRFSAPSMVSKENQDLLADRVEYLMNFARKWIGSSYDLWSEYTLYLDKAVEFFKARMFLPISRQDSTQSVTSYMCGNSADLIDDLERVNSLLLLAWILLWKNVAGQHLVAQYRTDMAILRLFEICLRVCARSNDSDPGNVSMEQVCSTIVNTCKRVLVTIMRFFEVLIENSSGRLLCLWLDFFAREKPEHLGMSAYHEDLVWGPNSRAKLTRNLSYATSISPPPLPLPMPHEIKRLIMALYIPHRPGLYVRDPDFEERYLEMEWTASPINAEIEQQQNKYNETDNTFYAQSLNFDPVASPPFAKGFPASLTQILKLNILRCPKPPVPLDVEMRERTLRDAKRFLVEDLQMNVPELEEDEHDEDGNRMFVTSESIPVVDDPEMMKELWNDLGKPQRVIDEERAAEAAKGQTITTAEREHAISQAVAAEAAAGNVFAEEPYDGNPLEEGLNDEDNEDEEEAEDESEEDEEDLEDDERDPFGEAFKNRGIVSELPLVLGPNEIFALPQILKAGVCLRRERKEPNLLDRMLKACQCHILVMQDTGRHILREMLIFVAAWDLNEEEHVYKIMLEVMESVLDHGLMPIAWHSFRETKDVVSPAQSILVKTLTHIFRRRRIGDGVRLNTSVPTSLDSLPEEFIFDKAIIETLLDDFRSTVVPQTVALIWLQGQIKKRVCVADDFPLNLWDMERVYEGVYQFLELFAVLTETQCWKEMLISHQLSFELISLLRELEECIPKGPPKGPPKDDLASMQVPAKPMPPPPRPDIPVIDYQEVTKGETSAAGAPGAVPLSVERPYDTGPGSAVDAEEDMQELSPPAPASPGQETIEEAQEASDFEWRNLKKLVVLVLSSLAYKSTVVKTQVRELGGVELVMKCFELDQHNPYLREHAVLCLNFLLEKCPENHAVAMEADASKVSTA